jgi:ribonuclease HII
MTIDIHCESTFSRVICGVDEAGKGAVLGPMVVAGVACDDEAAFEAWDLRDSKALTARRRETFFERIRGSYPFEVVVISANEIDSFRATATMNAIVAEAHAAVIDRLQPNRAIVDACDVNPRRYRDTVASGLQHPCEILSEHRADENHACVAAASIVAKVLRDRAIRDLAEEFGDIGSGYPSDPKTCLYLGEYIATHGSPPACARASWKTVTTLMDRQSQASLFDF